MATNLEIRRLLADLVKNNAATGPLPSSQQSLAMGRSVLNPVIKPYITEPQGTEDIRGPSPLNRIIDVLSRPLYTAANPFNEMAKIGIEGIKQRDTPGELASNFLDFYSSGGYAKSALSGLTGKDKTTASTIFETLGAEESGADKAVASFAGDVLLDPLTYVGGLGLVNRIGKSATKSVEALGEVERASGLTAQNITKNLSEKAAKLSNPQEITPSATPPRPTIPLRNQVQEPPRTFMAGPPSSELVGPVERTPTVAVAGVGDTIATPVPKPLLASQLVEEISGTSPNWRKLQQRQLNKLPDDADITTVRNSIEEQIKLTRSPVEKNMLRQQLKKLDAGVQPAHLVDNAIASSMPEFPKINLTKTRATEARRVADDFVARNKFEEINNVGQTRLYNSIFSAVKRMRVPAKAQKSVILHMLRTAEDWLLGQGRKLVDSEGYSVRLSDYINASGGSKNLSAEVIDAFRSGKSLQIVEDLKASQAKVTAEQLIDPILKTADQARQGAVAAGLSSSRITQFGDDLSKELSSLANKAGASSKEAGAAKNFVKELFDPDRDQLYTDIQKEARNLLRQSMSGQVDANLIHRLNGRVYDALGGNPKAFGNKVLQSRVVEAMMIRVATWFNAKDIRPFAREYIDTARNIAAAYHQALTPLVRSTTRTQRHLAWGVARGKATAGSADEQDLSNRLKYLIENIVGADDVSDAARANSVVVRGGITMSDLNKELPPQLRFTDKAGVDNIGKRFDYSNGNWMDSWKEWNVDEPTESLYQLVRATQLITRKNAFLDDAAARWAVPVKGGEYQHTVDAQRLKGFYFPKQIADQLNTEWKRLESDKFHYGGPFLQFVDKIQRMWKSGVTIYSPSHHIRNFNGDMYLAALDGVVTATPYKRAMQVMHAHKGRYRDIESVQNIMDADLLALATKAQPGKVLLTTKSGFRMTNEQVYQAAESQGILLRAGVLEDLIGSENAISGTFGNRFAPLGGRLHNVATKTSETRDHFVRLAHFIDVLSKSRAKNLRDAIEIAGRRVKKFHPDGSDLTTFERNVMRRLVPFYSWLRKSTPLVLEGLAMRPHVSLLFPKAMANLQEVTGIESNGPGDPFPVDQMFPDWVKEKGIGPVIPPDSPLSILGRQQNRKGPTPGYVVVNPTNPLLDQLMELTNPQKTVMSNLTPFIRIPGELATGHTSLGIPLEAVEGGTAGHLAQQVPAVGVGARITGRTRPDEPYHPEQLINWLTSAGITGTGPFREQANFEIREELQRIIRENRKNMQ